MILSAAYFSHQITKEYYENKIIEIKQIHEKNNKPDPGKELFEISLGLNVDNAARFSLLEKAAIEFHNVYAAVTLANLYRRGVLVQRNYDKALYLYQSVEFFDTSGIVLWCLGWMYEQGYSVRCDKKKAYEYYCKSMKLGYAKAYNSVGKFLNFGIECEKDTIKAGTLYDAGAEMGDINAMLNAAFLYEKDKEQVKLAESKFKKSIEYGSQFGKLRLGKLYMDNPSVFNISPQKIADLMIEAIKSKELSPDHEACAYYWLAKLILSEGSVSLRALTKENIKIKSQYCFLKSYTILFSLNENEKLSSSTAKVIWESLSNSINIKLQDEPTHPTLF